MIGPQECTIKNAMQHTFGSLNIVGNYQKPLSQKQHEKSSPVLLAQEFEPSESPNRWFVSLGSEIFILVLDEKSVLSSFYTCTRGKNY